MRELPDYYHPRHGLAVGDHQDGVLCLHARRRILRLPPSKTKKKKTRIHLIYLKKTIFYQGAFFESHLKDYHRKMNDSQSLEAERIIEEVKRMQKDKELDRLEAQLAKVTKAN